MHVQNVKFQTLQKVKSLEWEFDKLFRIQQKSLHRI